jgi:hypothetical protein
VLFNPDRVLNDIPKPQVEEIVQQTVNTTIDLPNDVLHTPVTWESLTCLRTKIEQGSALDSPTKHHFQKLANTTEKAFADRTILLDENRLLFEQNNEKITRQSVKSTMPGNARIMTYDDIVEAEQKRAAKVGAAGAKQGRGRPKSSKPGERKRVSADELEIGNREIKALGLEEYCSVLQF